MRLKTSFRLVKFDGENVRDDIERENIVAASDAAAAAAFWCLLINYLLHKHNNQWKVINFWLEAAEEENMKMETAENKWKIPKERRRREKVQNRIQRKSV